jgi:hypothetical protein
LDRFANSSIKYNSNRQLTRLVVNAIKESQRERVAEVDVHATSAVNVEPAWKKFISAAAKTAAVAVLAAGLVSING